MSINIRNIQQLQFEKANVNNNNLLTICQQHNQYITNYCLSLDCMKALCPDCIDQHTKKHLSKGSVPQIESVRSVRKNCIKKVNIAIQSIQSEIDQQNLDYLFNPDKILEEGIQTIRQHKEFIQSFILNHFEEQEEIFIHRIQSNLKKANDVQAVFQKFNDIIGELDYLQSALSDHKIDQQYLDLQSQELIQKVCLLDLKKLVDKSKDELVQCKSTLHIQPLKVVYDESRLENIKEELNRYLKISIDAISYNQFDDSYNMKPATYLFDPTSLGNLNNQQSNQQGKQNSIIYKQDLQLSQTNEQMFLNYFEANSKNFYELGLQNMIENNNYKFTKLPLHIQNPLPQHFKSITLDNLKIYLTGGISNEQVLDSIMELDVDTLKLNLVGKLNYPRYKHAVCYFDPFIIFVGGYDQNNQLISECEKFNIQKYQISSMGSLNFPTASSCITTFRDSIFKFGGMGSDNQLAFSIERYDFENRKWHNLWPEVHLQRGAQQFTLYANMQCCPLNDNEIFVFGGCDSEQFDNVTSQCFNFELKQDNQDLKQDNGYIIKDIIFNELSAGEFTYQPICYNNTLYILQNVLDVEAQKRILTYNGEWKTLK